MADKSEDLLDDAQAEVETAILTAERLIEHLRNAESCETIQDFTANISEAFDSLRTLKGELTELKDKGYQGTLALGRERHKKERTFKRELPLGHVRGRKPKSDE